MTSLVGEQFTFDVNHGHEDYVSLSLWGVCSLVIMWLSSGGDSLAGDDLVVQMWGCN